MTLTPGHDAVQKMTLIPRAQARGLTWFLPGEVPRPGIGVQSVDHRNGHGHGPAKFALVCCLASTSTARTLAWRRTTAYTIVVGVEGLVEVRPHGAVHAGNKVDVTAVDGAAGEPAYGLRDGPDVASLLVAVLVRDLRSLEVEARLARAGCGEVLRSWWSRPWQG